MSHFRKPFLLCLGNDAHIMKLHILAGDTSVYVETKKTGHQDQYQRRVKQLIREDYTLIINTIVSTL